MDNEKNYQQLWRERSIRVSGEPRKPIKMYAEEKNPNEHISEVALKGITEKSLLDQLFFSAQNIENIQNMIRYKVYNESNQKYMIDKQDTIELHIIMRAIYLQYSRNNFQDLKGQIQRLNEIVVDEITPKILSNIQQYLKYLNDISRPYNGIGSAFDRPINVSSAGLKTLSLDKTIGIQN